MTRILYTLLLVLFIFPLISARSVVYSSVVSERPVYSEVIPGNTNSDIKRKTVKLGFFKRMLLRMYMKKLQKRHFLPGDHAAADSKATASLWLGIAAIVFLFIPTYTIFLVIPLGIMAIVFGKQALSDGTSKELSARLGKGFGIGALIALLVFFLIALVWISSWGFL